MWVQNQPDATVKDLVEELRDWVEEGYVATAVWKRVQNCIASDVLPTFSKRRKLRQQSLSAESLTSVDISMSSATDVCTDQLQASGMSSSPGISTGK